MSDIMSRNELIFWFSQPPKVERGAYNEISNLWGNKVYYVCYEEYSEFRKALNWDDKNFGNAHVLHLGLESDKKKAVQEFIQKHKAAINIIPGFTSSISRIVLRFLPPKARVCVVTERPVPFFSKNGRIFRMLRWIYWKIRYRQLFLLLNKRINAVLPLGRLGVEAYHSVGWPEDKLFGFMYCPEIEYFSPIIRDNNSDGIRFLYVGRFQYSTKGIDFIQRAVRRIETDNWTLDMAGGYGPDRDDILKWIKSDDRVNFIGAWNSNDVISMINKYDVVIVPSKGEGWSMIVHEAVAASVGVIVTDQAVSHELIEASGAGIVIPSYSVKDLTDAMNLVIENNDIINQWKMKAKEYQYKIDPKVVANYFLDIMDWIYYSSTCKPECPWTIDT